MNEQTTRLYLASEAQTLGRGGKQLVAKLAGVKRGRIGKRIVELASGEEVKEDILSKKKRKSGGGLKQHKQNQSGLTEALESIVNPHTRRDPMRALLWSSKSLRKIEKALKKKGIL